MSDAEGGMMGTVDEGRKLTEEQRQEIDRFLDEMWQGNGVSIFPMLERMLTEAYDEGWGEGRRTAD